LQKSKLQKTGSLCAYETRYKQVTFFVEIARILQAAENRGPCCYLHWYTSNFNAYKK